MPPEPRAIKSDTVTYVDANGNPTSPPTPGLPVLGWGGHSATKVRRVVYDNGEIWTSIDDSPLTYYKTDPQLATQARDTPPSREVDGVLYERGTEKWEPAPGVPIKPLAGPLKPVYDPRKRVMDEYGTGYVDDPNAIIGLETPSGTVSYFPKDSAATLKPDPWQNPIDGSVIDLTTGKPLSGPIPGYIPGVGVQAPQRAPLDSPSAAANAATAAANAAETARHNQWNEQWTPEQVRLNNLAAQQRQDAADAARRRDNLLNAQVTLAGNIGQQWNQMAPYAAMEGQQYHLAGAPGGIYANIARMSGRQFNPEDFRLQPLKFDGLAAWRAAQGVIPKE